VTATAGCVLSSAQLNTLEKVSAVRSQRPVQADPSSLAVSGADVNRCHLILRQQSKFYVYTPTCLRAKGSKLMQGSKFS
jgi:hypothetical protein